MTTKRNFRKKSKSLRKGSKKTRHTRSRRTARGRKGETSAAAASRSSRQLSTLLSDNPGMTSGVLSKTLPTAIKNAKLAIIKFREMPDDEYIREDAINKVRIADYWTNKSHSRKNWRFEQAINPDYNNGYDWYHSKKTGVIVYPEFM